MITVWQSFFTESSNSPAEVANIRLTAYKVPEKKLEVSIWGLI